MLSKRIPQSRCSGLLVRKTIHCVRQLFLPLTDNRIGNEGLKAIADALRINSSIKELNFTGLHSNNRETLNSTENRISDAGILEFTKMLKINSTLTKIYFRGFERSCLFFLFSHQKKTKLAMKELLPLLMLCEPIKG
jgi:hypothetical protein